MFLLEKMLRDRAAARRARRLSDFGPVRIFRPGVGEITQEVNEAVFRAMTPPEQHLPADVRQRTVN